MNVNVTSYVKIPDLYRHKVVQHFWRIHFKQNFRTCCCMKSKCSSL